MRRIKAYLHLKLTFAIRYFLYPILAILTFLFIDDALHGPKDQLIAKLGQYSSGMLLLLLPIEMFFPIRQAWKTTKRLFWRRDLPMLIIISLTLTAINDVLGNITAYFNYDHSRLYDGIPFIVATIGAILITDFITYWIHRACHTGRGKLGIFLWRIHMPHHLPKQVYLLIQSISHPINLIIVRSTFVLPLFFLGFSPEIIFVTTIITTLQGMVSHFNVDSRVGWLNYLLIGTELHRYHHSAKFVEAKNFGIVLSIWDQLFGTFYYHPGEVPVSLGVDDQGLYPKDTDIIGLMAYPFRGDIKK